MKPTVNPSCLRRESTLPSMMADVLFALCALLILPAVYYGWRPLVLAGVCVVVCEAAEIFCCLMSRRAINTGDLSPMVTGMTIALLLPVCVPLWLPCVACLFAVFVVRAPFGGVGHTPFNPAAAGIAFVTLCWPQKVFSYVSPSVGRSLPAFADCVYTAVRSPDAALKSGLKPDILPLDLLWGNDVGAVGTTAILVIAACGLFLFFRRTANWGATACFLAAAALYAVLFPRIATSALTSVKYELLTGSLFFTSVFLINDPATSPRTGLGRGVYGALCGVLVMLLRHYGAFEQGACFAVLLGNAVSPLLDGWICSLRRWGGKRLGTE